MTINYFTKPFLEGHLYFDLHAIQKDIQDTFIQIPRGVMITDELFPAFEFDNLFFNVTGYSFTGGRYKISYELNFLMSTYYNNLPTCNIKHSYDNIIERPISDPVTGFTQTVDHALTSQPNMALYAVGVLPEQSRFTPDVPISVAKITDVPALLKAMTAINTGSLFAATISKFLIAPDKPGAISSLGFYNSLGGFVDCQVPVQILDFTTSAVTSVDLPIAISDFRDMSPHTQYILHIPFVGDYTIPVTEAGSYRVTSILNYADGTAYANIYCDGERILQTTVNSLPTVALPSYSGTSDITGTGLTSLVGALGGIVTGNPIAIAGAATGFATTIINNAITNSHIPQTLNGSVSGLAGLLNSIMILTEIRNTYIYSVAAACEIYGCLVPAFVPNTAGHYHAIDNEKSIFGVVPDVKGGFYYEKY